MTRLSALFTVMLVLAACSKEESEPEDPRVIAGNKLFSELCSECHTPGIRGNYLKNIPATLLQRRSEKELVIWIKGRDRHREMPSFVGLSDDQLDSLAAYLISLRAKGR